MVVIRLTRVGKKNSPAYRVVVADKQRAVKRKFIEVIGHYNPISKPKEVVIDKDRALFWLERGAKPSDTVRNLMGDLEIIKKSEKINKVYGKAKKKKELKEDAGAKKPEAPAATTENPAEEKAADEAETPNADDNTAEVTEETEAARESETPAESDKKEEETAEEKKDGDK